VSDEVSDDRQWAKDLDFEEPVVHEAGKRIGVTWAPWMGDWFVSYSPRNGNSNAEGHWDHWVDLALHILADPLTAIVRPDVHDPGLAKKTCGFYAEANRTLTDSELRARFEDEIDA
jgi:hypothetical protein